MPKRIRVPTIKTDDQLLHEVLVALAECHKHRRWYASFALPYLGSHPIEVGSGLGDYADEWLPHVQRLTLTDSNPGLVARLTARFAVDDKVTVRRLALPCHQYARHTCALAYNVLEHIHDHVEALRSMARLTRPGGYIVVICPAFPFAMSKLDIGTGHFRRYTRSSMIDALKSAGLQVVSVRYANSLGLIGYYISTKLLNRHFSENWLLRLYDRLVVPAVRYVERVWPSPPFGQSIVVIARSTHQAY
jgi:SAM-dependent methyltransferase